MIYLDDMLLTPYVVIIAYTAGVHSGRFMSTLLRFWWRNGVKGDDECDIHNTVDGPRMV